MLALLEESAVLSKFNETGEEGLDMDIEKVEEAHQREREGYEFRLLEVSEMEKHRMGIGEEKGHAIMVGT